MQILSVQGKFLLLPFVLALSGCSRDPEALDRFSRAYTAFLNEEFLTLGRSLVPVVRDLEKEGRRRQFYDYQGNPIDPPPREGAAADTYWTELRSALDVRGSNTERLEHARNAINADRATITKMMDDFASEIDRLDGAVSQLIEIANSIQDREYRADAVGVSQRAREVQAGFASLRALYAEAFERRLRVLGRIVEDGGAIRVSPLLKQDSEKLSAVTGKAEECRTRNDVAMAGLRDAFGALAGKSRLKKFPSKFDEVRADSVQ